MARTNRRPYRPLEAWRALRALLRDKEDTAQVFRIINALGGPATTKLYGKFRRDPNALGLLEDRPPLCAVLGDEAALAALPAGSLGAEYAGFMARERITADGLVEASAPLHDKEDIDAGLRAFAERLRDQHDLYHVLCQYGRDGVGEVCNLAFTYAFTRNPGLLLIILAGIDKFRRELPGQGVARMAWEAYRLGRGATFLPAADWEALLPLPLEEVRRRLAVGVPERYLASGLKESEPPPQPALPASA